MRSTDADIFYQNDRHQPSDKVLSSWIEQFGAEVGVVGDEAVYAEGFEAAQIRKRVDGPRDDAHPAPVHVPDKLRRDAGVFGAVGEGGKVQPAEVLVQVDLDDEEGERNLRVQAMDGLKGAGVERLDHGPVRYTGLRDGFVEQAGEGFGGGRPYAIPRRAGFDFDVIPEGRAGGGVAFHGLDHLGQERLMDRHGLLPGKIRVAAHAAVEPADFGARVRVPEPNGVASAGQNPVTIRR